MEGLVDAEYLWQPVPNCLTVRPDDEGVFRWDGPAQDGDGRVFTTLAWRLTHIANFLEQDRNGPWLGQPAQPRTRPDPPSSAADALVLLDGAYEAWSVVLAGTTDESLSQPIGEIAGRYGNDSRRSFVLHTVDELIHHGAECALLRDLYSATRQA